MENQNLKRRIFILCVGIFLFTQTASAIDATADVKLIDNWPKYKGFGQISGVSLDTSGNVFVFHRGDRTWGIDTFTADNKFKNEKEGPIKQSTIVVFHPETGDVITETGASMFFMPHGLTVDHENNIWTTDVALHQVFKFAPISLSSNTTNIGVPTLVLGTQFVPGKGENQFCKPTDVAVDSDNGDFFVSDGYCNTRIVKFDRNGTKLLEWGKASKRPGIVGQYDLFIPHALSLAQERNLLFVADRENRRVVAYNSNNGNFFKQYATEMNSPIYSVFYCPYHGGLIHALVNQPSPGFPGVSNPPTNRVSVYQIDSGQMLFQYSAPKFFQNAHDIALNRKGNASYVVDLTRKMWKFTIEFHEVLSKKEIVKSPEANSTIQIVPTRLKEEDFWGGTNIAIALVTFTIVIALLVFLFHIQKRKGAYRRSEMRGLILDDDEDEGINLS